MKISLRKAHALEKLLKEATAKIDTSVAETISIHEDVSVESVQATIIDRLNTNIPKVEELLLAAFEVRCQIAEANERLGVNTLLREKALIEATERVLSPFKGALNSNPKVIERQLEALKSETGQSQGRYGAAKETVAVCAFPVDLQNRICDDLDGYRRRKVAIADKLLGINLSNEIELSQQVVSLVDEYKLL